MHESAQWDGASKVCEGWGRLWREAGGSQFWSKGLGCIAGKGPLRSGIEAVRQAQRAKHQADSWAQLPGGDTTPQWGAKIH